MRFLHVLARISGKSSIFVCFEHVAPVGQGGLMAVARAGHSLICGIWSPASLETATTLPYKSASKIASNRTVFSPRTPPISMPQPPPRRRRPPPKPSGPPLWVMGLFIAGLIGTMVWVIDRFVAYDKLQQCVTAGHRDCGPPVDVPKPDTAP